MAESKLYISNQYAPYSDKVVGYWVMDRLGSINKKPFKSLAKAKKFMQVQAKKNPSILKANRGTLKNPKVLKPVKDRWIPVHAVMFKRGGKTLLMR
jgi:hypothetical protein